MHIMYHTYNTYTYCMYTLYSRYTIYTLYICVVCIYVYKCRVCVRTHYINNVHRKIAYVDNSQLHLCFVLFQDSINTE